jgi:hypothetical protein
MFARRQQTYGVSERKPEERVAKVECKVRCKRVCTGWAQDGFKYCRACRAYRRAAELRFREAHPEWYRAYRRSRTKAYRKRHPKRYAESNRRFAAKYRVSTDPKAVAYRERSKAALRRASANWTARNPERKTLHRLLRKAISMGEIIKPPTCQDCSKPKKLAAWGLAEDDDGIKVERWLCWHCWWRRRRVAQGRE